MSECIGDGCTHPECRPLPQERIRQRSKHTRKRKPRVKRKR